MKFLVLFQQMKRLRQWEEEKSVLEEGLKATKVAHEWYKTRLEGVAESLRRGAEPSAAPAANTEAMQVTFTTKSLFRQNT